LKTRHYQESLWYFTFCASGILLAGVLIAILGLLLFRGSNELTWEFLTTGPKGLFLGMEGGIYPAIMGTIALLVIATSAATLPALATAVYLTEYSTSSRFSWVIDIIIRSMVGLPSILIGLFGYAFFVLYLDFGISLISGALTLAIMVFPTLVILMRDALCSVNADYRLAGLLLGVSRWYILRRVVLPQAAPSLFGAVLLAMGHAAGATAPIMVTAAVIAARAPSRLLEPVMALPYHLYILFSQYVSLEKAYATALILVVLLLTFNVLSVALRLLLPGKEGFKL